jgi:CRP-like cAMP-binding protein
LLSRIFGRDKDRIRELEGRVDRLEEALRQAQEERRALERRIEALGWSVARVGAADAKVARGLMELIRIIEREVPDTANEVQEEAHWSPSPEVEDQILRLLREGGPATPRAIAEKLGKTREHLSRTLRSMAQRGKIARRLEGKVFVYSIPQEL